LPLTFAGLIDEGVLRLADCSLPETVLALVILTSLLISKSFGGLLATPEGTCAEAPATPMPITTAAIISLFIVRVSLEDNYSVGRNPARPVSNKQLKRTIS
jgi:hypothetical protein